ncbi:2OG-Fe(II) oxygenase [Neisseriaceae bacterium TC5R-5]|nr:2OG-Fe(II) oxygenase [Neisseriaceae bacterium TC5R-5]
MKINKEWRAWIVENTQRGCTVESMVAEMVKCGFAPAYAAYMLELHAKGGAAEGEDAYQYESWPLWEGNTVDVGDRLVGVSLRCDKPQIMVFDNVLSDEECDEVIARSRHKLQRSVGVDEETGENLIGDFRTSEGTHFKFCEDSFITRLENRVAKLMALPIEHGEAFQVLRYGVGAEYVPHFDHFPEDKPGSAKLVEEGGQRSSTMVIYLNDVEAGGSTSFPELGLNVLPRKGSAVYFRYLNSLRQIDLLTLHGGSPVVAGEKWVMTKWMHERAFNWVPEPTSNESID